MQARNFTTNVPKFVDLKIVFRTDIFRKLLLGALVTTSLSISHFVGKYHFEIESYLVEYKNGNFKAVLKLY